MIISIIGCLLIAIGVNAGFIPVHLFSVGFQGVGVLSLYTFHISVGLVVFILNVPLFILAWKYFGKKFTIKNAVITSILSIFLDILYPIHNLVHIPLWVGIMIGGTFLGFGSGLIFRQGLTCGGVGLLARLIQISHPTIKMGTIHIIFDFFVLLIGALLTDVMTAFYTFIASFISGRMMDITKTLPTPFKIKQKGIYRQVN
jgi:uncharacterized membrane-anchored protein YitT (DUF2179 family)